MRIIRRGKAGGFEKGPRRLEEMSRLWSILDVFSKNRQRKVLMDEDDKAVFVKKYQAFRDLLQNNNQVLLTMGDMQEKAGGGFVFDRAYIRSSCDALSGGVGKIVEALHILADGKYDGLDIAYQKIDAEIRAELTARIAIPETGYALSLKSIGKDDFAAAGGKFSALGELTNALALPVPKGFVITTRAYDAFARHNGMEQVLAERAGRLGSRRYEDVEAASNEVRESVRNGRIPQDLERAVLDALEALREETGRQDLNVAVRSSELHEDIMASFAGQYESALNVAHDGFFNSYKRILASQFTPRALFYYMNRGFAVEEMAMAVGVLAMVEARVSGVMYSRDPGRPEEDAVLINAVRGLGPFAVEGAVPTDNYTVSGREVVRESTGRQESMLACRKEGGTEAVPVPEEWRGTPTLTDEQVFELVGYARTLESHFEQPQDIEWAMDPQGRIFLLQSRPLRLPPPDTSAEEKRPRIAEGSKILIRKGTVACRGVGAGPVHVVSTMDDLAGFPEGGVLVVRHSYPEYAAVLQRASALVSDIGTVLGHLATVAREYNVPALFNTENATQVLANGMMVTVDAVYANVYEGVVSELTGENRRRAVAEASSSDRLLKKILNKIIPLNLTDPRKADFSPEGCRTFHDITRFAHEVSLRAIFDLSKDSHFAERSARQLVSDVPLKWWVIDLDDGTSRDVTGKTIRPEEILSVPMQALWKGMIALPWKGPPPMDAKGFIATVISASTDSSIDPAVGRRFADKNYILVARNFCNVSTRLGFHFSTIEAFLGEYENQNYINFVYTGGGADADRKNRRADLISRLLEHYDFRVEKKEDTLLARIEGHNEGFLKERMKVLGHIIVHTRQMDMVMFNEAMVKYYFNEMVKDIDSVLHNTITA